jgi:MFS family permease
MNSPEAREPAPPEPSEWRDGWRIILACALASGTGVVLLFFSFSLFLLPIMAELKVTRGEFGVVQAMVIAGALGAPVIGWLTDRHGFRAIYVATGLIVIALELYMAFVVDSMVSLAVCVGLLGFFGVGTTALTATRPISAHFRQHRGKALGLVVAGTSLATILVPGPLQAIMEAFGWRWAVSSFAVLLLVIGMPAVLFLLPRHLGGPEIRAASTGPATYPYWRDASFWFLGLAGVCAGAATSGFVGQLSPMIQEEGVTAATAALGLSIFALGQLVGRVGGGVLLDNFPPRRVAVLATLIPGTGFLLLYLSSGSVAGALFAAFLIGLLAGLELDVSAYFVSRLFPLVQYSTIYGALHGIGWIGNAVGVIGVGLLHDQSGSYRSAQIAALLCLIVAAGLFYRIRPLAAGISGGDPALGAR